MQAFSGSYNIDDVCFLLKPIEIEPVSIEEKEKLIQSGKKHYSEMISKEILPSKQYLSIFYKAVNQNKKRMAKDLCELSAIIAYNFPDKITLVSLARSGTPIGVLLKHILKIYFSKDITHYSISIVRDRGIDENALRHILFEADCPEQSIVFVDGWTGKGVIAKELKKAVCSFNKTHSTNLSGKLYVLADLCGISEISASNDDYLIPSSILNSTISGLVSRSILNYDYISHNDFHGCVYYHEFKDFDLSNYFIDIMLKEVKNLHSINNITKYIPKPLSDIAKKNLQHKSNEFIKKVMNDFKVQNINYIKPGIGEATRVMLRRIPDKLILKDDNMTDVKHLLLLAQDKNVTVLIDKYLLYNACSIIQRSVL